MAGAPLARTKGTANPCVAVPQATLLSCSSEQANDALPLR